MSVISPEDFTKHVISPRLLSQFNIERGAHNFPPITDFSLNNLLTFLGVSSTHVSQFLSLPVRGEISQTHVETKGWLEYFFIFCQTLMDNYFQRYSLVGRAKLLQLL
jgi:hypothetical protein